MPNPFDTPEQLLSHFKTALRTAIAIQTAYPMPEDCLFVEKYWDIVYDIGWEPKTAEECTAVGEDGLHFLSHRAAKKYAAGITDTILSKGSVPSWVIPPV